MAVGTGRRRRGRERSETGGRRSRFVETEGGDAEFLFEPACSSSGDMYGAAGGTTGDPPPVEEKSGECGAEGSCEVGLAFRPVEACAGEAAAALLQGAHVDSVPGEPGLAAPGEIESIAFIDKDLALEERLRQRDAEFARQVVVTGAGSVERTRGLGLPQVADLRRGSDPCELLECFCNRRVCEPDVAVAAGPLNRDQAAAF